MTNDITTTKHEAPAAFGSRGEIQAVADRIKVMLPGARLEEWQLAPKYRDEAERNLEEALYRAAQVCVFYRLVPGEDVHIIRFGNSFAVDMGIETWKKAADRYASLHGITWHIHSEEMPLDMLKDRRESEWNPETKHHGGMYNRNDVGAIAYLWRSDKAGVYEIFGAKEAMSKGYGVWAAKAHWDGNKKAWTADTIPSQRTAFDVAVRRATKMVLKAEFSLDSLLAATPDQLAANQIAIENEVQQYRMDHSMITRHDADLDEDGVFVVEEPRTKPSRQRHYEG